MAIFWPGLWPAILILIYISSFVFHIEQNNIPSRDAHPEEGKPPGFPFLITI
jgi:hypothetical protein